MKSTKSSSSSDASHSIGPAIAGTALASMADGGNGNIGCPATDLSFYCKLSRFTKIVQMILTLLIIFGAIAFLLYFLYNSR